MVEVTSNFTKVPNEFFDVFLPSTKPINFVLCIFIFRKTYGRGKKSDIISLSQFEDETPYSRMQINTALKDMEKEKLIKVKRSAKNGVKQNRYELNFEFLKQTRLKRVKKKKDDTTFYHVDLLDDTNFENYVILYAEHLADSVEAYKPEAFKRKVLKNIAKRDKEQMSDFERFYLDSEIKKLEKAYKGKKSPFGVIVKSIYPFYNTTGYGEGDWNDELGKALFVTVEHNGEISNEDFETIEMLKMFLTPFKFEVEDEKKTV